MTRKTIKALEAEVEDLKAKVADADRCAAQALTDRDVYRTQVVAWEARAGKQPPPADVLRIQQMLRAAEQGRDAALALVAELRAGLRYYKLKARRFRDIV